jgi:hypothetical protein
VNKDLAVKLAMVQGEGLNLYEQCKLANTIYQEARGSLYGAPFIPSTLAQIGFTEYLAKECTQRETDLVAVQTFLEQGYRVLHSAIAGGCRMSPQDLKDLNILYAALKALNLLYLLLDGVDEQLLLTMIKETP